MKSRDIRKTLLFLLAPLCGIFFSCSFLPRNLIFTKDNLVLFGYQESFLQTSRYHAIEVGGPEHPYVGKPAISLRLSDGTIFRTDRFDVTLLRKKSERIIVNPRLRTEQQGWPRGIEEIQIGGYIFLVVDNQVVWFGVYSWINHKNITPPPEVGDAAGAVFYRLPLDETELLQLFGKPDRISYDYGGLL